MKSWKENGRGETRFTKPTQKQKRDRNLSTSFPHEKICVIIINWAKNYFGVGIWEEVSHKKHNLGVMLLAPRAKKHAGLKVKWEKARMRGKFVMLVLAGHFRWLCFRIVIDLRSVVKTVLVLWIFPLKSCTWRGCLCFHEWKVSQYFVLIDNVFVVHEINFNALM